MCNNIIPKYYLDTKTKGTARFSNCEDLRMHGVQKIHVNHIVPGGYDITYFGYAYNYHKILHSNIIGWQIKHY